MLANHADLEAAAKIARSNLALVEANAEALTEALRRKNAQQSNSVPFPNGGNSANRTPELMQSGAFDGLSPKLGYSPSTSPNPDPSSTRERSLSFWKRKRTAATSPAPPLPSQHTLQALPSVFLDDQSSADQIATSPTSIYPAVPPKSPVESEASWQMGRGSASEIAEEAARLRAQLAQLSGQHSATAAQLNSQRSSYQSLKAEHDGVQTTHAALLARHEQLQQTHASLQTELESLSQALFEEANSMVADERKARAALEEQLDKQKSEIEELRRLTESAANARKLAASPSPSLAPTSSSVSALPDSSVARPQLSSLSMSATSSSASDSAAAWQGSDSLSPSVTGQPQLTPTRNPMTWLASFGRKGSIASIDPRESVSSTTSSIVSTSSSVSQAPSAASSRAPFGLEQGPSNNAADIDPPEREPLAIIGQLASRRRSSARSENPEPKEKAVEIWKRLSVDYVTPSPLDGLRVISADSPLRRSQGGFQLDAYMDMDTGSEALAADVAPALQADSSPDFGGRATASESDASDSEAADSSPQMTRRPRGIVLNNARKFGSEDSFSKFAHKLANDRSDSSRDTSPEAYRQSGTRSRADSETASVSLSDASPVVSAYDSSRALIRASSDTVSTIAWEDPPAATPRPLRLAPIQPVKQEDAHPSPTSKSPPARPDAQQEASSGSLRTLRSFKPQRSLTNPTATSSEAFSPELPSTTDSAMLSPTSPTSTERPSLYRTSSDTAPVKRTMSSPSKHSTSGRSSATSTSSSGSAASRSYLNRWEAERSPARSSTLR